MQKHPEAARSRKDDNISDISYSAVSDGQNRMITTFISTNSHPKPNENTVNKNEQTKLLCDENV